MAGVVAGQIGAALGAGLVGQALIDVAVGFAFSAVANKLMGAGQEPSVNGDERRRQLSFPDNLPPYRHVHGNTRATATVMPHPVVGEYGYGVYLLNSRRSVQVGDKIEIWLDERGFVLASGDDPFDFGGPGASPAAGPLAGHVKIWIGLGDQTGPPAEFLSEAAWDADDEPLGYRSSDKFTGLTVVFVKYWAGTDGEDVDLWPNVPPALETRQLTSAIYDWRKPGHDPDDETTWEASQNKALILVDGYRMNPVRPHTLESLHLDSFTIDANLCDNPVALAAGGSEARYAARGTLIFDGSELHELMAPIHAAGASRPAWFGGQLGVVPGAYSEPVMTMTRVLGRMKYSSMQRTSDLPTVINGRYVAAERGYTYAQLPPRVISDVSPGEEPKIRTLTFDWVTSATQGMRLIKIAAYRAREQRRLTAELPPGALDLVIGSGAALALGEPYDDVLGGTYEVESIHPLLDPLGSDAGVALRATVTLVRAVPDAFTWSVAEEQAITNPNAPGGFAPAV
ncbi:hypothetical protein ACXN5S_19455 [Pseudoroseicyclus sp. H15]